MVRIYNQRSKKLFNIRIGYIFGVLVIALIISGGFFAYNKLYRDSLKPFSASSRFEIFTVDRGLSADQIGKKLQQAKLIKSSWAFSIYVHKHAKSGSLQAGEYDLSPSMSVADIVDILNQGKQSATLVTIYPGERIDQVEANFINKYGFSPDSVKKALDPGTYSDVPVLAIKPAGINTLEGMLWPDSFSKDINTDPSDIIRQSLEETNQKLTPDVQNAFNQEGLNSYQGLTLASIILSEVNKPSDQTTVAQVFLSRIKLGMNLGSDVTALYGAIAAGQVPSLNYDSPYNTLIHKGLPPSPISTINDSSLYAATHPANTNYLYFVTGDNGTTYFATTYSEHQSQTNQYCHKLCSQ